MKKLMMIATLGATAVLIACGDDSSSNSSGGNSATQLDGKTVVSCNKVQTIAGIASRSCHAIAADDAAVEDFKADCAPISELDKIEYTIGTGCTDYLMACDVENQVEYFYDEASTHFSCAELGPHTL